MKKRLNLDVDKLMNHPVRKKRTDSLKITKEKQMNFQQMYNQAKKTFNQHHCNHTQKSLYYHSQNNSIAILSESLKASRKTPQNSSRNHQHLDKATYEKLNKSLQTKSHSIEQKNENMRSNSSEFKIVNSQNRSQKELKKRSSLKNNQQRPPLLNDGQNQYEGKELFKKEWEHYVGLMNHNNHEHLRGTQCFLNIQQMFQLLKELHYIRKTEDEKYLVKIWKQLEGQTYGGIPSNNLYQFLTYVNHSNNNYYTQKVKSDKKNIRIDGNLKIVASQTAKLQVYEDYLALRVNKILYGSNQQSNSHQKTLLRTSNIKIVEEQSNQKRKIIVLPKKTPFNKKTKEQVPVHHAQKLLRVVGKHKEQPTKESSEQNLYKDKSQETICYSEFSQTRQSGKNLTSNSSESSFQGPDCIQQIILKKPLFSVDVNIGEGISEKIVVYQGQTARQVSKRLVQKYKIDDEMRNQFQQMLSVHIRNLLFRIEQVSEDFFSDREE